LGRALIKLGHTVEFVSTDGFDSKYCPNDIRPHVRKEPSGKYDCQVSYTAPHNWPVYLQHGDRNRFAIWNFEYDGVKLLRGFAKFHRATTKVLPSSYFTKQVFTNMGIPEESMVVVPHGISLEDFETEVKTPLRTKKRHKILFNIAQPHKRKAIPLALEGFGKAFTRDDDVCLVAKVFTKNKTDHQFDVDFHKLYKTFERKFPKHAEVEFYKEYVPNIAELYHACDINYSGTHAECWHLPSLEALAAGLVNVVPRYGGQLDFCNDDNSLLIDGKIARAPRDHQYWNFNPFAVHFVIDTNDAAKKLQQAVENYEELHSKFEPHMKTTAAKFTWESAAQQILDLCIV
jgi:glycosyltransferase involved in cell wall biosynthesis